MKCKSGDLPVLILSFLEEGTFKVLYHLTWVWLRDEVFPNDFLYHCKRIVDNAFLCAPSSREERFF